MFAGFCFLGIKENFIVRGKFLDITNNLSVSPFSYKPVTYDSYEYF
jgi:hypothetical protein